MNWYRFLDLHCPMQTTSLLLLWVMGRIKGLQRGYVVSHCKNVKGYSALACTERSIPISYTLFTRHSAQPTKHQRQSRTVCRDGTFPLIHFKNNLQDSADSPRDSAALSCICGLICSHYCRSGLHPIHLIGR